MKQVYFNKKLFNYKEIKTLVGESLFNYHFLPMKPIYTRLLFLLVFSFYWISIYAQSNNSFCCDSTINKLTETKLPGELFQIVKVGQGSQFFTDEWLVGDVYLTNNSTVHNIRLKYNGFLDELIWLESNSFSQIKLDKDLLTGFSLKDPTRNSVYNFSKVKIKKDFDSTLIFSQLLYSGKISLMAYRRVVKGVPITVNEYDRSYYKDVYQNSFVFYFLMPNGKTVGFKSINKKNLFALFPERAEQIKKALKEKRQRRFKTENDLIKVTEILNSVLL
jgi:hypothetical protein